MSDTKSYSVYDLNRLVYSREPPLLLPRQRDQPRRMALGDMSCATGVSCRLLTIASLPSPFKGMLPPAEVAKTFLALSLCEQSHRSLTLRTAAVLSAGVMAEAFGLGLAAAVKLLAALSAFAQDPDSVFSLLPSQHTQLHRPQSLRWGGGVYLSFGS